MSREEHWIRQYEGKDALWIHDGNPHRPHALLTSGNHSNGFFNSRRVIPDEELLREAASDLLDLFVDAGGILNTVEGVVGPQTGATKLAELMSEEVTRRTGKKCFHASPRKEGEGDEKVMVFSDEEAELVRDKVILICEDVLTTGGSVKRTIIAAENAGATVLGAVLMLVNRSGEAEVHGKMLIALITRHLPAWGSHECPLCKLGSKAIPAKDPVNWAALNADYPRLCIALDGLGLDKSLALAETLGTNVVAAKVHDLVDKEGSVVIGMLKEKGVEDVWVDYKIHDTPDTVGLRVAALAANGAKIVTVHASGGIAMMQAALKAARTEDGIVKCEIWAITVLTSHNDEEIKRIYNRSRIEAVLNFALMAHEAGCDGLVCSALEVEMLAKHPQLVGMKLVVPGTRSQGVALGQQKRSDTPANAIANGATYLVAGSQVTKAADPKAAFEAMSAEIK